MRSNSSSPEKGMVSFPFPEAEQRRVTFEEKT